MQFTYSVSIIASLYCTLQVYVALHILYLDAEDGAGDREPEVRCLMLRDVRAICLDSLIPQA